jgi:plastocyanin
MSSFNSQVFASTYTVSITSGSSSKTSNAYSPNPIVIVEGGTVKWVNNDSTAHTVTSGSNGQPDGNFDSSPNFNPIMASGQSFSHTFNSAGTFPYYCGLHPNMVGTVVVDELDEEEIKITVKTDKSSYDVGETITITGRVTGETPIQPVLIQVYDPEGQRDRIDQIEADSAGYYSYSFVVSSGSLLNTQGSYTVIASYKTAEKETSFYLSLDGEPKFSIQITLNKYNFDLGETVSVNGDVRVIGGDADLEGTSLAFVVNDWLGQVYRFQQLKLDSEGEFHDSFRLPTDNHLAGDWRVEITYQDTKKDIEFQLMPAAVEEVMPLSLSRIAVKSITGAPVGDVSVGQQVLLGVPISNDDDKSYSYTLIIQVLSSDNTTVMLNYQTGSLAVNQSSESGFAWTPDESGQYTLQAFAISGFISPEILADSSTLNLNVS